MIKYFSVCVLTHTLEKIFYAGGVFNMATKGAREHITLECTECHNRNYVTEKNKKNNSDRLEIKKYCRFCKKSTTHKETK